MLISPYIRPGSVRDVYYNHYSWLRTMEDMFNVATASPGLDGQRPPRLRGPARPGAVRPDVFNNPAGEPRNAPGFRLER